MEKCNGVIPQTVDELIKLIPGIGMYSASAIASVAFQKPVGVVDGNVIRVLSRLRVIGSHVTQLHVRNHLWYLYKIYSVSKCSHICNLMEIVIVKAHPFLIVVVGHVSALCHLSLILKYFHYTGNGRIHYVSYCIIFFQLTYLLKFAYSKVIFCSILKKQAKT